MSVKKRDNVGCNSQLTRPRRAGLYISRWLLVVLLQFLVIPVTSTSSNSTVLTLGYLANIRGKLHRQGHIISGAMTYAVQDVMANHILPGNYTLKFVYSDTRGETLTGTNAVINMWRDGVIAFIGPQNSCEVEATVAAALNLPMISYKCSDSADKDNITSKDYRSHFARTYPPNSKVVNSTLALLRYYEWYKFSIIYENSDDHWTVVRSLEKEAQKEFKIKFALRYPNTKNCHATPKGDCLDPFPKIVQETYQNTRVYVFLGDKAMLCSFLLALQMRGLLETGNYVVIYTDFEIYTESDALDYFQLHVNQHRPIVEASQSLLVLVSTPPRGHRYEAFEDKVREFNQQDPFNFPARKLDDQLVEAKERITPYASYIYDAVFLYADALGKALRNNTDPRDGREIMRIFRQREEYTSVTGALMRIDKDGDAEGNYTVLSRQPTPSNLTLKVLTGISIPAYCMLPVGRFLMQQGNESAELRFKLEKEITWVIPDKPPLDEPPCGFDGKACAGIPDKSKEITSGVLGSLLLLSCFIIYMIYKNWKYEQEIDGLLWKIDLADIQKCGFGGIVPSASRMSFASHLSIESKVVDQIFTQTAMFKGNIIAVKQLKFNKKTVEISRKTKKEMKIMREMHHDYINQFIGACVNPNCIYIVTEYCAKGSLQDILENDDLKLDNMFIASLVFDLIKGMIYLTECDIKFHGNLKSSNCVISSRWVLQITDFGLHELRFTAETGSVTEHQRFRNLLWKAPELLRNPSVNPYGTQKGDVYAFGIILHEIIARQGPFGYTGLNPKEIVMLVKEIPGDNEEPFRPSTDNLECQDYVVNTMKDCWHERADLRPDFYHIKEKLRKMREGMKPNIMDNMMSMMEKYAYNLEELVDERTVQLVEEKKKTEALLHRMLPKSVANQLMRGESVIPESFDAVTIYFSDIVGFTAMSASSTPMEVVTFLNDLYIVFDDIISHYDVYKVETIGDAYMVVSGLPIRNGDNHAGEIAFMALELLESIHSFKIRHKPNQTLKLRIGIHTGPVAAGVVGLTMPRYCLFGDTVNTASRMESNGEPLKIHISPQCKDYLDRLGGYYTSERGPVMLKGKGEVTTFWLVGHTKGPKKRPNSCLDLPPAQPLFSAQHREEIRRRSPKLGDTSRRGSLGGRRNSSYINCASEDTVSSSPCKPVFLRFSQESPRSPKRLSPHITRDHSKLLKAKDPETGSFWFGEGGASSCGELNNALDLGPTTPLGGRRAKLESICSEDCELCSLGNPESMCECKMKGCRDANRNGLINMDESMKPLLCTNDSKVDLILPKEKTKEKCTLKVPSQPSKRWRSCDEIVLPKGSRASLKEFISGLLGNRGGDLDCRISSGKMLSENCNEESLV